MWRHLQDEPIITAVISLDRHLEGARFAQFWQEVEQLRELVNPGARPMPGILHPGGRHWMRLYPARFA